MFSSASRSMHLAFFLMAMTERPTSILPCSFPFSICKSTDNLIHMLSWGYKCSDIFDSFKIDYSMSTLAIKTYRLSRSARVSAPLVYNYRMWDWEVQRVANVSDNEVVRHKVPLYVKAKIDLSGTTQTWQRQEVTTHRAACIFSYSHLRCTCRTSKRPCPG